MEGKGSPRRDPSRKGNPAAPALCPPNSSDPPDRSPGVTPRAATVSPCEVRAPGTVARRDLLVHLDIGEVVADERSTYRPDQLFDRSHVGCLGPPRVKRRRTCSVSAVPRLARAGGARADGMIQFCPARLATHA